MVVDEGYSILAVAEVNHTGGLVGGAVGFPYQFRIVMSSAVEAFVNLIFEREVERSRGLAGSVNPPLYSIIAAIPIFTYRECRIGVLVVDFGVLATVSFYHIQTEAYETEIGEQILAVIFAVVLHVGVCVVEVACTVEIFACISGAGRTGLT